MTFWSQLLGGPDIGAQDRYIDDWLKGMEGPITTATGIRVTVQEALTCPGIAACVQVQSEDIAKVPLVLKKRSADGKSYEPATDHPLFNLFKFGPSPWLSSFRWRKATGHGALAHGNHYNRVWRNGFGDVEKITPIQTGRCGIRWAFDGEPFFDVQAMGGTVERGLTWQDIVHIAYRDSTDGAENGGVMGVSPIMQNRETVALMLAAEKFAAAFFANGAQPSMILETDKKLADDDVAKRIRAGIERVYGGLNNKWKVAILEMGMKMRETSFDPAKSQLHETRKLGAEIACQMYRTPPHKIGILDRATFCLPAGSSVFTEAGPRPIEAIAEGDLVWSQKPEGGWTKSRVVRSACTGEDDILTLKTTNRTLRLNGRHRVLVRRSLSNPQPGRGGYQHREWRNEYVPASDLQVGDAVVGLARLPSEGVDRTPSGRSSIGFLEFCGLLLGDGNVYPKWGVSIARAATATYMPHYRAVIQREFQRYDGGNGRGDRTVVALAPVELQEFDRQTRFASVLAARELQTLGLCGTARTKSVPGWVFGMTEEHRLAFLRGFLDADGSVDKLGRISFSSVNGDMLAQIRHLCMSCGIPVTNQRQQIGETTLPNGKRARVAQWAFTCSDPGANRRIGSNDLRYVERLNAGRPFGRKGRGYPRYGGAGFDLPGCELSRIVSIDRGAAEPVYDLEVETTHNFVAEGVVVHNSNIEQQSIDYVTGPLSTLAQAFDSALTIACLTPRERETYKIETNLEGLMRGDILSRYRAYAIGRQWGWLSVNKILERENENGIGPDGDTFLNPLNMVTAGEDPMKDEDQADEPEQEKKDASIWMPTDVVYSIPKTKSGKLNGRNRRRLASIVGPGGERVWLQ